jgi:D-alanyl-D-alanine carboxypeptidase (penicillin-binding protein 5/6)
VKCALYAACALVALVIAACDGTASATGPAATQTPSRPTAATTATTPTQSPTAPAPPAIQAPIAYLFDPLTGAIYLTRDADQEVAMASTTKIMTAVVAITYGKLDAPITISADAASLSPSEFSIAFLRAGDQVPLRDLLYALLLPSGDDAAIAIAEGVAGSQAGFVALMNLEAAFLGLTHTHYTDVHGLDAPGCDYTQLQGLDTACNYTSAADLAHLAAFAMRSSLFATIVATPDYALAASATHTSYDWHTTNQLLTNFAYQGATATGVKTGSEVAAGECLVFSAAGPYGHLLGVVLHDGDFGVAGEGTWRFADASALLKWGVDQQVAVAQRWSSIPPVNAP